MKPWRTFDSAIPRKEWVLRLLAQFVGDDDGLDRVVVRRRRGTVAGLGVPEPDLVRPGADEGLEVADLESGVAGRGLHVR